jgi:hypothetical protein
MDSIDKLTDRLKKLPSEMKMSERWEVTGETMATFAGVGTLAGAAVGLVLFRGVALRAGMSMFGTGFGGGMAWQKCSDDFERAAAKGDEKGN